MGLKALEPHWITAGKLKLAVLLFHRKMKRDGKVCIRIFPDKPVSKKPLETRMGKGKGAPEFWVVVIKPGRILFEVAGVSREVAHDALKACAYKLPIKTKVVPRPDIGNLKVHRK